MRSRPVAAAIILGGALLVGARPAPRHAGPGALRVCADPNNLPFTNRAGEGFENRLAELVARDLGDTVSYYWFAERRGFVRNTLKARHCDVVFGVPPGAERLITTHPYYRSTYVFVYRRDRGLHIRSFDDPALKHLRIGVHLIGDDYNSLPPAVALARRGLTDNLVGFSIYGDYRQASPPGRLIDAVARGDVDLASAWGPLAGYFALHEPVPLDIVPVAPDSTPAARFIYSIAAGVRPSDIAFRDTLDAVLTRHRAEIQRLLTAYGVPLVPASCPPGSPEAPCD